MMKTDLSFSLSETISNDLMSIGESVLEAGIDTFTSEGFINEVPIISTAISIYKIGNSVRERHYLKKLAAFVYGLQLGIQDEALRQHYIKRIQDDSNQRDRELEYILIIIDRYIQTDKTQKLASFYLSYLNEDLSWDEFAKCAEILDRMLPGDYKELLNHKWEGVEDKQISDSLLRLVSFGLVYSLAKDVSVINTVGSITVPSANIKDYILTAFGAKFVNCLKNDTV